MSAISGGLAQVAVGRAYAHAPAARIAALTYSGVLFTYVLEAVLFHRVPAPAQIAGAALVIAGGVLVSGVLRVPEPVTAE